MLDAIFGFFLNGNNDILAFIITTLLCVIPLVLIWKSTYVVDRPYNQYASSETYDESTQADSESNLTSERTNNGPFDNATIHFAASFDDINGATTSNNQNNTNQDEPSSPETSNSRTSFWMSSHNEERENQHSTQNPTETSSSADLPPLLAGHHYVRLKFLDDSIKIIQVKPTDTIGEFKRKSFPLEQVDRYRLIFRGQVLRNNNQTIQGSGIIPAGATSSHEIPVVHCFLSAETDRESRASNSSSRTSIEELNVGHFFLPLLGSVLAGLWYMCIYHTSLFTIPSIFGVVGLTCFFIVLVVNRYV